MAGDFEGRSSATREVEQAIVALKKGAHILKCGKRGKPKFCTVRLSYDEKELIWYSKERGKHLSLSSVSSVVLGQKTTKLMRLHWPEKESQSLSLIYKNGESSLDLICKDRDQAECWYLDTSLPQVTNNRGEELEVMESILLEEMKQLRAQVITLAEECRHRSLKVQLYKRKVEETCLTVRDEATKCKAAQEIIKVLTNQRNALSKTLSGGMELEDSRIKPSCVTTKQPVTSELPDPPDKTIVTGKFPHIIGSRNQHNTAKMDMLSEPTFNVDDLVVHQNRRRMPNGSSDYDSGTDTINVPSDCSGVIEQIERGVYVTVVTSPSGKKGIKRIKFSRKHFGQKEAQKWWEENKSRVFEKYSFMEHFAV
ncbi:hypothetical protein QOZ80_2BG0196790 [Eleusine coracana subsp. coracana]|nr:hypothetical protein QOZ80_2BG0196790 [Eleusine coracana subsp. coracana]